ncbi:hypothetical protein [Mycobacterium intracellulare]|uniref:hypothetical protein n=1 Tax=Mycobacterium intracellulare TaxID=1767 RepID=UPI000BAC21BA|nr:hypothetical protein [Mycobacterium intracellulare]ASX03440.1 hypothetical protein CKJ58_25705 [Mycobacterium intracellulare subsp. chimaera]PBA61224.1 hypothetical protein CKJ56_12675 [Mycobacterium intracellulare subsp. chimaera]
MEIKHHDDAITVALSDGRQFLVSAYLPEADGIPVIQVDTDHRIGRVRVNLNDGTLWDGDPDTDGPVDD